MQKWLTVVALVLLVLTSAMVLRHAVTVKAGPIYVANGGAPIPPSPWLNGGAPIPPSPWANGGAPIPPSPWHK